MTTHFHHNSGTCTYIECAHLNTSSCVQVEIVRHTITHVRFFILPTGVSPKESRHLVNKRVIEHLSRAGVSPAVEKEIVYIEKNDGFEKTHTNLEENYGDFLKSNLLFSKLPFKYSK